MLEPLESRRLLATITVSTLDDIVDPSDIRTSLREAVAEAESLPGADRIELGIDGSYLLEAPLILRDELTIEPAAGVYAVIDLTPTFGSQTRLLIAAAANVELNEVDIRNADTTRLQGGAIYNTGTLALNNCLFLDNHATFDEGGGRGGAIYNDRFGTVIVNQSVFLENHADEGGAIYNLGRLVLNDALIASGDATLNGGGVYNAGTLESRQTGIELNEAGGDGGGIYNAAGTVTLAEMSRLSFNKAEGDGAGIYSDFVLLVSDTELNRNRSKFGDGGAIYNAGGTVTIDAGETGQFELIDNSAGEGRGGAIFNGVAGNGDPGTLLITGRRECSDETGVCLHAGRFETNAAGDGGGIFNDRGTTDIVGVTFAGNNARESDDGAGDGAGGGIHNVDGQVNVSQSSFVDNHASMEGAGIYSEGDQPLTIFDSHFDRNHSSAVGSFGGAISSRSPLFVSQSLFEFNSAYHAGAIDVSLTAAPATIEFSQFRSNRAGGGRGGAIRFNSDGALAISDTEFDSNHAAASGAAIYTNSSTPMNIARSTFVDNSAESEDEGNTIRSEFGDVAITNSTLDGDSGVSLAPVYVYGELTVTHSTFRDAQRIRADGKLITQASIFEQSFPSGTEIESLGFNIFERYGSLPGSHPTDVFGRSALLGDLDDHGGPTRTIALLPDSPALDLIDSPDDPFLPTDQRGITRPLGTSSDSGAFESGGFGSARRGGHRQTAYLDEAFLLPLTVEVFSAVGEPVAGGLVRFHAPDGQGVPSAFFPQGDVAFIDENGLASIIVQANSFAGSYEVIATSNGANPVSFELTNLNHPPQINTVTTNADEVGKVGVQQLVQLEASFVDQDLSDQHVASIDWGDGNASEAAVTWDQYGQGTVSGIHLYSQGGIFDVEVELSDRGGDTARAATVALITGVGVHDGSLQVVGTAADDYVHVRRRGGHSYQVFGWLDGITQWKIPAELVQEIEIVMGAGNDRVTLSGNVRLPCFVDGGAGNDVLRGGGGNNVLVGGAGNDLLFGGRNEDLLVGGSGSDWLWGQAGDDLLVASEVRFEDFRHALKEILQEWEDLRDANRTATRLNSTTIDDDQDRDRLFGGGGTDWYFYDPIEDFARRRGRDLVTLLGDQDHPQ